MRIPGLKTLKHSARWVRSRFTHHAVILGYHRIADEKRDPYSLCVSPPRFDKQMEVLRNVARPMKLEKLAGAIKTDNVPNRAVVITFDDGYADNLYNAAPLLEKHQIPATVFMATGYIGKEFWWDKLARILFETPELPKNLDMFSAGLAVKRDFNNSVKPKRNLEKNNIRGELLSFLYQKLLLMPFETRNQLLDHLHDWSAIQNNEASNCRAMTSGELLDLANGGMVDVGSHTVTHPVLSRLSAQAQTREIMQSKQTLEATLKRKVKSFSYPHGLPSDETRTIVRGSGFSNACASYNDVASAGTDCFHLPRFWVKDSGGKQFERWLKRWLSY
jgi:peptidoglycan/xylan/chitin deacetylase (PgdA/CDA1 family)